MKIKIFNRGICVCALLVTNPSCAKSSAEMAKNMKKSNDLLLVIDMQNVYLPENPWGCHRAVEAAGQIIRLIESGKPGNTVFTVFTPPREPRGVWKQYNTENSSINRDAYMNEIMDCFKPYVKDFPVLEKSVYSSYAIQELRSLADKADHVLITGVVAECCVLATAMSAIDAGHKIYYLKDAVSGLSGQTESAAELILSGLSPLHAEIMTVEEYLRRD